MVHEYARAGAVDLEDYLNAGPPPHPGEPGRPLPRLPRWGRLDAFGRLLAFPFARSLAVQYYNEDLLGAAGHSGTATLSFEEFRRQVAGDPPGQQRADPSTATTSAWTPP